MIFGAYFMSAPAGAVDGMRAHVSQATAWNDYYLFRIMSPRIGRPYAGEVRCAVCAWHAHVHVGVAGRQGRVPFLENGLELREKKYITTLLTYLEKRYPQVSPQWGVTE